MTDLEKKIKFVDDAMNTLIKKQEIEIGEEILKLVINKTQPITNHEFVLKYNHGLTWRKALCYFEGGDDGYNLWSSDYKIAQQLKNIILYLYKKTRKNMFCSATLDIPELHDFSSNEQLAGYHAWKDGDSKDDWYGYWYNVDEDPDLVIS
jgi:hypothetical protein